MNTDAMPAIPVAPPRPRYTFTMPKEVAAEVGIQQFTLVLLTSDEEMMATRRCHSDQIQLAWELVKSSFAGINGKKISLADGTVDTEWAKLHPKARNFLMQAYNKLHNPQPEEVKSFLDSMSVQV